MNCVGNKSESKEVGLELKYCERCGGLFLRTLAKDVVHCGSCRARLAALRSAVELSGIVQERALRRAKNRAISGCAIGRESAIESLRKVAVNEERPC